MKYFQEIDDSLAATFEFVNFQKALDFVNQVWNIAEISNHHPNISLHNYKKVTIQSTTHDTGNTVTEKDFAIAKLIEASYKR